MRKVAVLPSLLTVGNLCCGFLSICLAVRGDASRGDWEHAAWLIFVAMLFDAFDGMVARWTRTTSAFGAELDSLADVVSFGVAPAALIAGMINEHPGEFPFRVALTFGAFYATCAALRLARFNVEPSDHRWFKGLPSPAAGMLIASLVITIASLKNPGSSLLFRMFPAGHVVEEFAERVLLHLLPFAALVAGGLMVSRIPYPHLTGTLLKRRRPFFFLAELVFAALPIVLLHEYALLGFTSLYVIWGLVLLARRPAVEPRERLVS